MPGQKQGNLFAEFSQKVLRKTVPDKERESKSASLGNFAKNCCSLANQHGFCMDAVQYISTLIPGGFDSQDNVEKFANNPQFRKNAVNAAILNLYATPLSNKQNSGQAAQLLQELTTSLKGGEIDLVQAFTTIRNELAPEQKVGQRIKEHYKNSAESSLNTLIRANTKQGEKSNLSLETLGHDKLNQPETYLKLLQGNYGTVTPFEQITALLDDLPLLMGKVNATEKNDLMERMRELSKKE